MTSITYEQDKFQPLLNWCHRTSNHWHGSVCRYYFIFIAKKKFFFFFFIVPSWAHVSKVFFGFIYWWMIKIHLIWFTFRCEHSLKTTLCRCLKLFLYKTWFSTAPKMRRTINNPASLPTTLKAGFTNSLKCSEWRGKKKKKHAQVCKQGTK